MKIWNRRTRVVVLSVILALIFLAIYAAGMMLPEELTAPSIRSTRLPPSLGHFFGTDALGRDLFFRTLKGLSVSMTVGLIASVISAVIAVFVGIAAATGSRMSRQKTGSLKPWTTWHPRAVSQASPMPTSVPVWT